MVRAQRGGGRCAVALTPPRAQNGARRRISRSGKRAVATDPFTADDTGGGGDIGGVLMTFPLPPTEAGSWDAGIDGAASYKDRFELPGDVNDQYLNAVILGEDGPTAVAGGGGTTAAASAADALAGGHDGRAQKRARRSPSAEAQISQAAPMAAARSARAALPVAIGGAGGGGRTSRHLISGGGRAATFPPGHTHFRAVRVRQARAA